MLDLSGPECHARKRPCCQTPPQSEHTRGKTIGLVGQITCDTHVFDDLPCSHMMWRKDETAFPLTCLPERMHSGCACCRCERKCRVSVFRAPILSPRFPSAACRLVVARTPPRRVSSIVTNKLFLNVVSSPCFPLISRSAGCGRGPFLPTAFPAGSFQRQGVRALAVWLSVSYSTLRSGCAIEHLLREVKGTAT